MTKLKTLFHKDIVKRIYFETIIINFTVLVVQCNKWREPASSLGACEASGGGYYVLPVAIPWWQRLVWPGCGAPTSYFFATWKFERIATSSPLAIRDLVCLSIKIQNTLVK